MTHSDVPSIRIVFFQSHRLMATNGTVTLISDSCSNGCNVTLDSGMPYISGPTEEVQSLQEMIGAKMEPNGDVRI